MKSMKTCIKGNQYYKLHLKSLSLSLSVVITKSQRLDCTDSMIIIKSCVSKS